MSAGIREPAGNAVRNGAPSVGPFADRGPDAAWTALTRRALWTVGRFLLSAAKSANRAWDVALDAAVDLLKAGGAACAAVAATVGRVPALGFGAGGVNEAIRTAVAVTESNVRHDMRTRENAFAALDRQMDESKARLSGDTAAAAFFPRA